jgi:hypothetical protein
MLLSELLVKAEAIKTAQLNPNNHLKKLLASHGYDTSRVAAEFFFYLVNDQLYMAPGNLFKTIK